MGSRHLFRFDLPCVYSRVTTAIHSLHLRCSGASLCLLSLRPARRLKQHVCWKKGAGEIWSLNSLISVPKGDWGHPITPSTGMVPHVTNRLKSRENYFILPDPKIFYTSRISKDATFWISLDYFGIFNSAKVPSFLQGETINVLISAGADVRHVVRGTRGHPGAGHGERWDHGRICGNWLGSDPQYIISHVYYILYIYIYTTIYITIYIYMYIYIYS